MIAYLPYDQYAALTGTGLDDFNDFGPNGARLAPIDPALRAKLAGYDPRVVTAAAGPSLTAPALAVRTPTDLAAENAALRQKIDAAAAAPKAKATRDAEAPWLTIGPVSIGGKSSLPSGPTGYEMTLSGMPTTSNGPRLPGLPEGAIQVGGESRLPSGPTGYEMTLNGMPKPERPGGGLFGMGGLPDAGGGPSLPELRAPNRGDVADVSNALWDGAKAAGGALVDGTMALGRNLIGPDSVLGRASGTVADALNGYQRSMRELHGEAPRAVASAVPTPPVSDPTEVAVVPSQGGSSAGKPAGFLVGGQADPDLWPVAPVAPRSDDTDGPAPAAPAAPAAAPRLPAAVAPQRPGVAVAPPSLVSAGAGSSAPAAASAAPSGQGERYRTREEIAAEWDKRVPKEDSFDPKAAKWNALMMLGLQMAASQKPHFGQALGEGGIAALNEFATEKKRAADKDERMLRRAIDREKVIESALTSERTAKYQNDNLAETKRAHDLDADYRTKSLGLQERQLAQSAAHQAAQMAYQYDALKRPDWQLTVNDKGEAVYYDVNSGQTRSPGAGLKPYSASQRGMTPMDLSLMEQRLDTQAKHQAAASGAMEGTPEFSRAYLENLQRLRQTYQLDSLNGAVYGRMGLGSSAAAAAPQLPPLPPGARLDPVR